MTGEDLKEYRLKIGWSQARLGLYWGISDRTISAYEKGRRKILYPQMMEDALIGLCYKLGVFVTERQPSNVAIIYRTAGNVICDVDDLEFFRTTKFQLHIVNDNLRVLTKPGGVAMTRLLLDITDKNWEVLPKNGNWLDLRRDNLEALPRAVTNHQNTFDKTTTSSKYRGVSFNKQTNKWVAHIRQNNRAFYLGLYGSETQAAQVYDKKARELYGEYAKLNFSGANND